MKTIELFFQLGDEHERTRESAQVLKHLTEQAVVLQKRINDVVKGQSLVIPSLTVSDTDDSFLFVSMKCCLDSTT